jgi:hypothetical protein
MFAMSKEKFLIAVADLNACISELICITLFSHTGRSWNNEREKIVQCMHRIMYGINVDPCPTDGES